MKRLLPLLFFLPVLANAASPTFGNIAEGNQVSVGVADSYQETVTMPTHDSGDLVLCYAVVTNNTDNPLGDTWTLTNFTEITSVEAGDFSAIRLYAWYWVGDGTTGSQTLDSNDTTNWATAWGCAEINGADTSDPLSGTPVTTATDSTTDVTASSVTTDAADTLVFWAYAQDDDTPTEADVATDAGWTGTLGLFEVVVSGTGNGAAFAAGYAAQASTGASATSVFSMNGDTEAAVTITLAINSPAAGGSVPVILNKMRQRRQ